MKLSNLILGSLLFAATAFSTGCVVGTQGTYANSGYVRVSTPNAVNVSHYPPAPLAQTMTSSPGYGHVWVDGYWHWNSYQWAWITGRWEYPRANYVYVAPYYDYVGNNHIYVRGYWSPRNRVPRGYRYNQRRANRPLVYRRPVSSYNPYVHGRRGYQTPRGWNNNRNNVQQPRRVQPRGWNNNTNRPNTSRPNSPFVPRPRPGNVTTNRPVNSRPTNRGVNQTNSRPNSPFVPRPRPGNVTTNRPVTPTTNRVSPQVINRRTPTRYIPVPTRRVVVRRNPSGALINRAPSTQKAQPATKSPAPRVNRGNLNSPIRRRDN